MKRILMWLAVCASISTHIACARLQVTPATPTDAALPANVAFVGVYDARVTAGGVGASEKKKKRGDTPDLDAPGYVARTNYPTTVLVRRDEVEPNRMVRNAAAGFVRSVQNSKVSIADLSGVVPLDARTENGLPWAARHHKSGRYLVSIQVDDAFVDLDDARKNYAMGLTASIVGVVVWPCLLYLPAAKTRALAKAEGMLLIFDRNAGKVVHTAPIEARATVSVQGFHSTPETFRILSDEVGKRLGSAAATAAQAYFFKGKSP